jgi:hypothetical protein
MKASVPWPVRHQLPQASYMAMDGFVIQNA